MYELFYYSCLSRACTWWQAVMCRKVVDLTVIKWSNDKRCKTIPCLCRQRERCSYDWARSARAKWNAALVLRAGHPHQDNHQSILQALLLLWAAEAVLGTWHHGMPVAHPPARETLFFESHTQLAKTVEGLRSKRDLKRISAENWVKRRIEKSDVWRTNWENIEAAALRFFAQQRREQSRVIMGVMGRSFNSRDALSASLAGGW